MALRLITALCVATSMARAQTPAPPPAAAGATGTIRGHVVAADSGQPLRKAELRLMRSGPLTGGMSDGARQPRAARTDVDGKYEFADVAAGRYTMVVSKASYVEQTWGQTPNNKPLEVHGGETLDRVDFSLQRGGVVTGRVLDEFGEPLSGVTVHTVEARGNNGTRDVREMNFASTNDLGEFRMFGIAPGQYYVKATWRRMGTPMDADSPDRTGYPDTFFPGTVNLDDAQRLTVRAGETISDLAMALSPIKTVRLHGSLADVNGKPLGTTTLLVTKIDGNNGMMTSGAPVKPDGTFIISNLTPGEYMLRAQPMPPRKESAMLKVTVGSEDIKDVRLVAVQPSTVSGRVVVDPAQAQSLPNGLRLSLVSVERGFFSAMESARVADDLTFELSAVAGRYRINWMNLPPGWMIRAIRINNTDVTDDDLEVKTAENISGIDVELTNKSGTIAGTVRAAGGDAAKDYRLVVFAADKKLWTPNSRYFRMGGPDKDGRFTVTGLPPGNYSVAALEHADIAVPFNDPEFLQRISPNADTVTLADGETRTIDLRLTSVRP